MTELKQPEKKAKRALFVKTSEGNYIVLLLASFIVVLVDHILTYDFFIKRLNLLWIIGGYFAIFMLVYRTLEYYATKKTISLNFTLIEDAKEANKLFRAYVVLLTSWSIPILSVLLPQYRIQILLAYMIVLLVCVVVQVFYPRMSSSRR